MISSSQDWDEPSYPIQAKIQGGKPGQSESRRKNEAAEYKAGPQEVDQTAVSCTKKGRVDGAQKELTPEGAMRNQSWVITKGNRGIQVPGSQANGNVSQEKGSKLVQWKLMGDDLSQVKERQRGGSRVGTSI